MVAGVSTIPATTTTPPAARRRATPGRWLGWLLAAGLLVVGWRLLPLQPGDVPATAADTSALEAWTGFRPATPVHEGVARFVAWYRAFYQV